MGRSQAQLREVVRVRDGDDCYICGKPIDFSLPPGTRHGPSLEHVVPTAARIYGKRQLENLRLTHAYPCNHAKGSQHGSVNYSQVRDPVQSEEGKAATAAHRAQRAQRIWFDSFSAART